MSLIDNSTRSGLSIRKCPKRGLTLLRAGLDTWLISPRIYPKNSNLMDKMSCSKIRRDKKVSEATNDPMRPSRTPPIKRLAPKSRYVEPMNLGLLGLCTYYMFAIYMLRLSMRFNFAGTPTYSLARRDFPFTSLYFYNHVSFPRRTSSLT